MSITRRSFIALTSCAAVGATMALSGCSSGSQASNADGSATPTGSLAFDTAAWSYDESNDVYWQVGVVYCEKPATTAYESLGIYVPGAYLDATENGDGTYTCTINESAKVGNWTARTAPIVVPVNTAGYSAQPAPTSYSQGESTTYLQNGFVYVNAGCRGRDNGYASDGSLEYSGGAPWAVTDLKAAIRYLRYNDALLPGDKEAVFTFGHSGGGAQSSIVGATGDSDLYLPYLEEIGAAIEDDDGNAISDAVAGAMCWCPITCLDEADAGYEWMMGQYSDAGTRADGTWTAAMSKDLSGAFADYINDLGLKSGGTTLTLEESDENVYAAGSYYDHVLGVIEESLNNFLADTEFPYTPSSSEMADMSGGPGGDAGGPGGDAGRGMPDGGGPDDSGGGPGGDASGGMPGGGDASGGGDAAGGDASGGMPGGDASGDMPGGGDNAQANDGLTVVALQTADPSDDDTSDGELGDGTPESGDASGGNASGGMPGGDAGGGDASGGGPGGDAGGGMPGGDAGGGMPGGAGGMGGAGGTGTTGGTTYQTAQDYIDALNASEQWITYDEATNTATVASVGMFSRTCKNPSKSVGAFDATDRSQAENKVFGNDENDALHFDATMTRLLQDNADTYAALSNWDDTLPDAYADDREQTDSLGTDMDTRVGMYNPLYYLCSFYDGKDTSNVAPHWHIRTGIEQGDTALTVETNLALALQSCSDVEDVDFATVWGQGHTTAERTGSSTENFIAWVEDCTK